MMVSMFVNALVEGEGNLRSGLFGSVGVLGEASLIQLAAEERENGRHRFDFFNGNFLAFLCDEANDALRRLLGDDRRNPGSALFSSLNSPL